MKQNSSNTRSSGPASRIKRAVLASAVALALAPAAHAVTAVTWDDIVRDHETTADVLTYGMGLKAQRYSPLKHIDTRNVAGLVPAWSFSFGGEKQRGQEAQAIVHDGVLYVTASYSRLFAIDARTGKQLWSYEHRLPDDIRPCCDVVNRGAAIYGDKIFFGTLDAAIVALDRKTGKVVWRKKFGDHKVGYTMTGAPTIARDKESGRVLLIHGESGDEFGVVGHVHARDPDTGEEIWKRPLVEGHMGSLNGKPSTPTGDPKAPSWPDDPTRETGKVEAWSHGGGAPWQSASFDVDTNTIVIGAGNPAPWNTWARTAPGDDPQNWDSLFTSGQAYVDASTGELKGFYQHTPNDAWDFSGNNEIILFEYKDPKTGRIAWEHKEKFPLWAGTLTTAGGLVFTGTSDGYVKAFDAKNGKELWKFQTGSGVVSVPITWEMDGEQYLGIQSGYGGAVPLWGGDMADLTKQVTQGGSMWVFKLPKSLKN